MEKRKESLRDLKICRFCLTKDTSLCSLYERNRDPVSVTLPLKILSCVSVEVFPSDKMPSFICERCKIFMDMCYEFKQICRQADETCLQFIQNESPLDAIQWPSSLLKIFNYSKKPSLVKTMTEGGATIEVTSRDISESEDEESFNIKINTSEDGSKACIKAITSAKKKDSDGTARKTGFSTVSKLSRHVRTHAGERAYPCKYCNKSFMKSHHYTRHLNVKHAEELRAARDLQAEAETFRCEQCAETFSTQDDLYYHSAIHATQNLICPLCQEKFENVDAVTIHIRTHVNGIEFMCEYCELVFTSKEKLDAHMGVAHEDEMSPRQEMGMDESSMEADAADADDDDEDNGLNVKEEGDHMVVEIKKADGYMLSKENQAQAAAQTNSEDSEIEATYTELSTVDTLAMAKSETMVQSPQSTSIKSEATPSKATPSRSSGSKTSERISILRKAEAMKRKAAANEDFEVPQKKDRAAKVDSTTSSTSDKSLRLLEKELQDLKRTSSRSDGKAAKTGEAKSKRQPVTTSTPKLRSADEKTQAVPVPAATEKKLAERRVTKEARPTVSSSKEDKNVSSTKDDKPTSSEKSNNDDSNINKEYESSASKNNTSSKDELPGSSKDRRTSNIKKEDKNASSSRDPAFVSADKELHISNKNDSINEDKEVVKNGETSSSEDSIRRSTRPSKIKNYASMIRDRTRITRDEDDDEEDSDDSDVVDFKEADSTPLRRRSIPKKQKPVTPTTPATATPVIGAGNAALQVMAKRRGRPRKDASKSAQESPEEIGEEDNQAAAEVKGQASEPAKEAEVRNKEAIPVTNEAASTSPTSTEPQSPVGSISSMRLLDTIGQTLKKVPIKSLPPGVKPMPLPLSARVPSDLCQMQIGKKIVKVQKIVMTKAEVEAMAKKGLVEMKDGTMVLKQGIKLPGPDPSTLRTNVTGQGTLKKVFATPTRCNLGEEEA